MRKTVVCAKSCHALNPSLLRNGCSQSRDRFYYRELRLLRAQAQVAAQQLPEVQVANGDQLGQKSLAFRAGTLGEEGDENTLYPFVVVGAARVGEQAELTITEAITALEATVSKE